MASGAPTTFVSYSRDDSEFVLKLVENLKVAGVNVWLDQQNIEPGQEWDSAIREGLLRASWILAILSPAAVRSRAVQDEINFALDESKTIIPLLHQECLVPWRLRRIQQIDFTTNFNQGIDTLLRTLRVKAADHNPGANVRGLERLREEAAHVAQLRQRAKKALPTSPAQAVQPLDEFSRAEEAAEFILARTSIQPKIAMVLGSGLGHFVDDLQDTVRIPYEDIPYFPRSTAIGHAGALVIGKSNGIPIAVMQGRVHYYEGYSLQQVTFPIRVLGVMGVRALVLTNAAGGINPAYRRSALVVIKDHINLKGSSPLMGPNDERFGPRFPDMTEAYNPKLRRYALEEEERLGGGVYEGVYVALHGPSYETPAEIRALRTLGADLVGMSTIPEVIVARHMGLDVLAISVVTNMAAGMTGSPLDHDEALEAARDIRGKFTALLRAVLPKIDRYLRGSD